MRPIRFHRTAAFRLAFLIALLFSALTAVQFGIVYFDFSSFARAQLRSTIEHEAQQLVREAEEDEGVPHLIERLRNLQAIDRGREFTYAIFDGAGKRLIGTLDANVDVPGWAEIALPTDSHAADEMEAGNELAVALVSALPRGYRLVVARDTDDFLDLRERIAKTLSLGAATTVLLALLGGVLISRRSLRRVDQINETAARIIEGDLSQRLPRWGSGDEFDRLSDVLNRMLQRIERLMLDVRHVTSDIAHDLRTPLARLRHGLEMLTHEAETTGEFQDGIGRALSEVDGVLDTFTALLRISEIEAGARAAGFRAVDLSALGQKLGDTYAAVVEDSGRHLATAIAPALSVRGDPDLLTQAVANLIENAVRHTPPGSRIVLTVGDSGGAPSIAVADNGPGIPPEARGAVLGRFSRLDASRSSPGHGLGLALVAAVAELHGATLVLTDNHPGLRVELTLPGARKG
ncbi:MAG: ATP-binding protein [Hyphomicrobiaceae bacterium]